MKRLAAVFVALLATSCGSPYGQPSGATFAPDGTRNVRHHSGSYPITHVVVIMQENRSFDNFFRGFPGANSATAGSGHGVKYTLQPLPLTWSHDMNHHPWQFWEDYDGGKNDGWDKLIQGSTPDCPYAREWVNHPSCWLFSSGKVYQQMAFSYTVKSDIQPYWTMAARYTLGDRNFGSTNGPSFGEHQMLVAGQQGHANDVPYLMPWGCDATKNMNYNFEYYLKYGQAKPPEFPPQFGHEIVGTRPCFTYPTVAGLLDKAGISWRWYVQQSPNDGFWLSAFDAIKQVRYGPDWQNVVSPDTQVLDDIASGQLRQVSWVMPHKGASDHAGNGSGNCGPAWITSIVNAIGQSPYWNSTAIIITWDEWGGWFDHVVPPQYADPVTQAYEGLGYRTPLIIVSPYAKNHYVSHAQHETASSLHFIEKMFGLSQLPNNVADSRADAYDDVFDFSKPPSSFVPIPEPPNYHSCTSQQHLGPDVDY